MPTTFIPNLKNLKWINIVKFAYSTNAFKNFSFEKSVKLINQIGYDGVEVLADKPHLYPAELTPKIINSAKDLIKSEKIEIANINAFTLCAIKDMHHPSWIEKEKESINIRIQHTIDSLYLAKDLGCKNISIQPGGKVESFSRDQSMQLFADGLAKVIPTAKKLGVKILIEPEPFLMLETSDHFLEFMKIINDPVIGLNLDLGHFYCVNEDPYMVIHKLKQYIGHIHIEDIKNRVHEHKILGHGDIDFDSIFKGLAEIEYNDFVTVELYPYLTDPVTAGKISLDLLTKLRSKYY